MQDGFEKASLNDKDAELVETINSTLTRLKDRRLKELTVSGPFLKSKLAWKVAGYQQAVLYRVVMLANGCALNWNANNTLCSILAARALMETVALLLDFEIQLQRLCNGSDFGGIDDLVNNRTFATRDAEWISQAPETKATNAVTFIDKLERLLPDARRYYDMLSEWCHPNSLGHYMFFATLDTETGTVTYSDQKHGQEKLDVILGASLLILVVENSIVRLDEAILGLAELHSNAHRSA
jgi:hypothetical protein